MKHIKNINNFINEQISDDILIEIDENDRIINSNDDNIIPRNVEQDYGFKPVGLWYSKGTEWIDWCRKHMPEWERKNVFELDLNDYNVLIIGRDMNQREFEDEYGIASKRFMYKDRPIIEYIDWAKVSEDYYGIEIDKPWGPIGHWLRGWDVSSGCIWNKNAINDITKLSSV